jgi:hypothetical protein
VPPVVGGAHSVFATILLRLLAIGMGHALLVEIRRQARRCGPGGWARHDTVNAVLLACWAEAALIMTILEAGHTTVRAVGLTLTMGYGGGCGYLVTERRRAIAAPPAETPDSETSESETRPLPSPRI